MPHRPAFIRPKQDRLLSPMALAVKRGLRIIGWKRSFLRKLDSGGYPDAPAAMPFWMRAQYRVMVARQEGGKARVDNRTAHTR